MRMPKLLLALPLAAMLACGHSDEEMAAKQREIDKLTADLRASNTRSEQDGAKLREAQNDIEQMREQLKQAGVGLAKSKEDQEKLRQALSEYKQRADQLAVIEGRFRELRSKLEKLNQIGLRVTVRNNRMVIQLPGDILFDSGKDELKTGGKDVLGQVAEVIRNDKDLNTRNFQVAGHTDNVKYGGGPFGDNWGLSLARSRKVLLFLIAPATANKSAGGGLNEKKWAASGYGETDPAEGTVENQTNEQKNKNRRVELVVQPNVEEMLNLNNIK